MEWTPVRIPTALFEEVTEIIRKKPELGYTNEHEFFRDALRDKITAIKENEKNLGKEADPT